MTDARTLTEALGGRWHGRYGVAACPCCQPERRRDQSALTVADGDNGRLVLHCKKSVCTFADILAAAGLRPGDWRAPDPMITAQRDAERLRATDVRAEQALAIWQEALPIGGTIADRYLRSRRITCDLPPTLRYDPSCWHGATATRHPALVAAVTGGNGPAIHRTYLRPDGSGKADVDPARMMLGGTAGGAVRLSEGSTRLVVCEGIETGLSLVSILGGRDTIWAALSTSGMRSLHLPAQSGALVVATDGDDAGRAAGHALAERAHALGWQVSLLPAPEGRDWNDVLTRKARARC